MAKALNTGRKTDGGKSELTTALLGIWGLRDRKTGGSVLTSKGVTKRFETYGEANKAAEVLNQEYGGVKYGVIRLEDRLVPFVPTGIHTEGAEATPVTAKIPAVGPVAGLPESERCNDTDETVVIIRANDRYTTYLGQVSAGLNEAQAKDVAIGLNRIFSERGVNWFARIELACVE